MTFLKRATAKLFLGPKLDDLAHSSPITEQNCDAIPNFSFPFQHQAEPVAHAIVSPLEPDYIHRPVTVQGERGDATAQHACRLSASHPVYIMHGSKCVGWPTRQSSALQLRLVRVASESLKSQGTCKCMGPIGSQSVKSILPANCMHTACLVLHSSVALGSEAPACVLLAGIRRLHLLLPAGSMLVEAFQ